MEELERYLDQVCRGIAGPRAMRRHIRQELREHLLDAVDRHREAGLSDEESIARALEDFGGPEQVRSELEAEHGHRLMAIVVDKAMQWKEMTMKAKWVWKCWAHVALAAVIALEVAFLWIALVIVMPECNRILREVSSAGISAHKLVPLAESLLPSMGILYRHGHWLLIGLAVAWGLFEWRVRSEHKTLMRLSGWGTFALGLMLLVTASALIQVICLPRLAEVVDARRSEQYVAKEMARIDELVSQMEQALQRKGPRVVGEANEAYYAARYLTETGDAAAGVLTMNDQSKLDEVRANLKAACDHLHEAWLASKENDVERIEAALKAFREVRSQLPAATKTTK